MNNNIWQSLQQYIFDPAGGNTVLRVVLIFSLALLLLLLFNLIIELLKPVFGNKIVDRAEAVANRENFLKVRRFETIFGLSLTVLRVLVVLGALFLAWRIAYPQSAPIAFISASTVVVLLASASLVPILRDVTYGIIMVVERWYSVGDHIVVEPFAKSGGIVERVTLRSTKLRSVNGEAIYIHHQNIMAVKVKRSVTHPEAIETFVNDPEKGKKLIQAASKVLPKSPALVPRPLEISEVKKIDDNLWRITAVCEVIPFREWLIDDFALAVIKKTDEIQNGKKPVIVHGPIAYYDDENAERSFTRSVRAASRARISAVDEES
ncbi:MAG TPA: mechanosensitive ion channel domain-containing protein [Candidatus Saccharimonadales bacterium]|nr:mechanosensitive ion channel domain-containing protein [Candidatus Saccharimonadales bacterium]